ncbi:hypothetical protein D3C71_1237020 [compost metagenome]
MYQVTSAPSLNFKEYIDNAPTSQYSQSISGTYNHSKTSYATPELTVQFSYTAVNNLTKTVSLEPITNQAPIIDGADGNLGQFTASFTKAYTVSDIEGDTITITEKINSTTIRTFSGTGAQTLDLSAQWAAIPIGKHTITVTINDSYSNPAHTPVVRTWTFVKILPANATLVQTIKGLQDLVPFLSSKKASLAGAIRGKGGTVNDTDSWDTIKAAIDSFPVKRSATGSVSILAGSTLTVSGLSFKPTMIIVNKSTSPDTAHSASYVDIPGITYSTDAGTASTAIQNVVSGSFDIRNSISGSGTITVFTWIAVG